MFVVYNQSNLQDCISSIKGKTAIAFSLSQRMRFPVQSLADVLGQSDHLLFLQSAAYKLYADVGAIVDLGVV